MAVSAGACGDKLSSAIVAAGEKLGYHNLRESQALAIEKFLSGRDVFVSLPTGSGKSLCYCVLPYAFDLLRGVSCKSIAIVVSPLVSLMIDQVRHMTERGITAVYVGDCVSEVEVCNGCFQLVFMSPESLLTNETWRDMLTSPVYQEHLVAVVIDEAHCVKKW